MENRKEIELVVKLLKEQSNDSFKNLSAINIGSYHKNKEDIVNSVSKDAQKYLRINSMLHDCLEWVLNGRTIEEYYDNKLHRTLIPNQSKGDKDHNMEDIEWLTELLTELKS